MGEAWEWAAEIAPSDTQHALFDSMIRRHVRAKERALARWMHTDLFPYMRMLEGAEADPAARWDRMKSELQEAVYRESNYGDGGIPVRYSDEVD